MNLIIKFTAFNDSFIFDTQGQCEKCFGFPLFLK